MPAAVRAALLAQGLMDAFRGRPAYQQNDYLGWIIRAKLDATKQRRLAQMLDELERGDRYMKMTYRAGKIATARTRQTNTKHPLPPRTQRTQR